MVITIAKIHRKNTYFKSATRSDHVNAWRFEGKLPRENEFAVIKAAFVRRLLRPSNHVMPFQNVGGQGSCGDVRNRVPLQSQVILDLYEWKPMK